MRDWLRSLQYCDLEMYCMSGQANSDLSYVGCPLLLVQSCARAQIGVS